jgi:membrane protease YdiL (CAAX protease family)
MSSVSSRLKAAVKSETPRDWGPISAVVLGFLAFKVPEWVVTGIAPIIVPLLPQPDNIRNFIIYGLFEALAIGTVLMLLVWFNRKLSDIGFGIFKANYILWAVMGFFAYFVLTTSVLTVVQQLIAVPDEPQQIGFINPSGFELVLAFIALVIVVPIAEELLFRGFIFKGIRKGFNFVVTSLAVSVLFAVAHGQLNVGIDVFCLSLVLCYLREKTASLWPGIMLHGFKNAIAFCMIFILGQ